MVELTGSDLRRLTKNGLKSYLLRVGFSTWDADGIADDVQAAIEVERQMATQWLVVLVLSGLVRIC